MYVDFRNPGPPPEPWKPERPRSRLTGRQEKLLVWIVCFNLLMLFLGPLAGVTLLDALIAYLKG